MTSAQICLYKFQLFVDLDINTLQVVFNKLRNFIFSVFIFYFSISFGATKFTSPRASNYLRPALLVRNFGHSSIFTARRVEIRDTGGRWLYGRFYDIVIAILTLEKHIHGTIN